MVDIVSIIIAVVSLIGSLTAAAFTGWITFYIDQVKRRAETKALIHKYRDPLTLAAYDLQSRIFGLTQFGLLGYAEDDEKRDLIYVYTAFLVGQYFSWTFILRRQAQFMRFATDRVNVKLNEILDKITKEFSDDRRTGEHAFMLWNGQQRAIGESMTLQEENGQLYCMGFAAFAAKYHTEPDFKKWFQPIEKGIEQLVEAHKKNDIVASYRLRRLQHLLIDLVLHLDDHIIKSSGNTQLKVDFHGVTDCRCDNCPASATVGTQPRQPGSKLPV